VTIRVAGAGMVTPVGERERAREEEGEGEREIKRKCVLDSGNKHLFMQVVT